MSQKCKTIEEKAKILLKTDPLKAKDEFLNAARCYKKNFKKKNYQKLMVKTAKILEDYSKSLDPFKAKEFILEASKYYEEIDRKEDSKSVIIALGNKFVNYAKNLEKSNKDLVGAIKYLLAAESIFLEQDEEERYHECTIFVYNICVAVGIPLGRINKYFKASSN
ncbi:MAG: hypothetical protein ACTSO9_20270 [Candidatus Helarchaeota archaeon]